MKLALMLLWQRKAKSLDPELQDPGGSPNLVLYMAKATTHLQLIPLTTIACFSNPCP